MHCSRAACSALPGQPEGGQARAGGVLHRQGAGRARLPARRRRSNSKRASAPSTWSSRSRTGSEAAARIRDQRLGIGVRDAEFASRLIVLASAAAPLASPARGAGRPADPRRARRRTRSQDLQYGDVLFYYYQDDYFEAITRLLAAQQLEPRCRTRARRSCCWAGCICRWASITRRARIFEALLRRSLRSGAQQGLVLSGQGLVRSAAISTGVRAGAAPGSGKMPSRAGRRALHAARQRACCARGATTRRSPRSQTGTGRRTGRPTRSSIWAWRWCARAGSPMRIRISTAVGHAQHASEELLSLRDKANLALGFA